MRIAGPLSPHYAELTQAGFAPAEGATSMSFRGAIWGVKWSGSLPSWVPLEIRRAGIAGGARDGWIGDNPLGVYGG